MTVTGGEIHGGTGRPAPPPWRRPTILVSLAMLASMAVVCAPGNLWLLGEKANVERLADEARRLGGSAGIPEGAVDFWGKKIYIDLDLGCANVGDEEFALLTHMAAFKHVAYLSLTGTRITDESLELLAGNPKLVALDVSRTGVTDKGLESIVSMPGVSMLNISGTEISDAGLETLGERAELTNLRSLDVSGTKVTAEGARRLSKAFEGRRRGGLQVFREG